MIIRSDSIRMNSGRSYASNQAGFSRLNAWNSSGRPVFSLKNGNFSNQELYTGSQRQNSGSMNNLMERFQASKGVRGIPSRQESIDTFRQMQQQSINYLLNLLFGKNAPGFREVSSENISNGGSGGQYYSYFYYSEQETTCFDATGTAVTADGREIPFNINLEMSRSFTQIAEEQLDFGQPLLCDPLVINLNNNCADVTDQKFFFDIDADGKEESISTLASGSGYLALDRNNDGVINDGSELFGTESGDGFKDLANYDKDGNGWIDEADEIFTLLRIWTKDALGNDQLLTLKEAGVGAICLGSQNTQFSLNSMTDNTVNAVIRKTGLFLYENGNSGTVQQLDLAT